MRVYCKGLTRQELVDMGIYSINWDRDKQEWWVDRYWHRYGKTKEFTHTRLQTTIAIARHKYGKDKEYPKVQFGYNGKTMAIPLGRLLYVWFVEDVPDGYVVDHKDNNPFNNQINNLQMLTIEDNIRKRYEDLGTNCINQFHNTVRG